MTGKKGLVMSVDGEKVVVLTTDGEFKKYKMPGAMVGEEVTLPSTRPLPYWLAAAALLLFVLTGVVGRIYLYPPAGELYAYVSMDINPSLELAVSRSGKVTGIKALNQDGERLAEEVAVIDTPVEDAVAEILAAARKLGYLVSGGNTVVFGVTPVVAGSEDRLELGRRLKETARKKLPPDNAVVAVLSVGTRLREEARSLGISPGKYAILLEAQEHGLNVSVETLAGDSIAHVIKQAGGNPGQIIGRAEKDRRLMKDDYKKEFKSTATGRGMPERHDKSSAGDKGRSSERKEAGNPAVGTRPEDKEKSRVEKGGKLEKEEKSEKTNEHGDLKERNERKEQDEDDEEDSEERGEKKNGMKNRGRSENSKEKEENYNKDKIATGSDRDGNLVEKEEKPRETGDDSELRQDEDDGEHRSGEDGGKELPDDEDRQQQQQDDGEQHREDNAGEED